MINDTTIIILLWICILCGVIPAVGAVVNWVVFFLSYFVPDWFGGAETTAEFYRIMLLVVFILAIEQAMWIGYAALASAPLLGIASVYPAIGVILYAILWIVLLLISIGVIAAAVAAAVAVGIAYKCKDRLRCPCNGKPNCACSLN